MVLVQLGGHVTAESVHLSGFGGMASPAFPNPSASAKIATNILVPACSWTGDRAVERRPGFRKLFINLKTY